MLPVPSNPNREPRALIDAIENGNLADVQKLLPSADHLKNFQTTDEKTGDSLIHLAVRSGNNDILELLLEKTVLDPNLANKNEDYPLNLAAEKSNNGAIKTLLEKGAISLPDKFGNTPLHTVIENNNNDGCDMLLKAGADINVLNSAGQSPLKVAGITKAKHEDSRIPDLLKSKNAKYDEYTTKSLGTKSGASRSAAKSISSTSISAYPLWGYFDTNAVSVKTLLDLAGGEVSDAYLQDVKKRINNLLSPELNEKIEAVKNDKNKSDEDKKNEIKNLHRSCIPLMKQMEQKNANDETPLIVASRNGSARIVEAFLIAGANVHARSKENGKIGNQTAIIAAARGEDNPATVKILIEHGANVNDTDATPGLQPGKKDSAEGWPVATICVMISYKKHSIESPKVLGALLKNGLNPDSTDKDAVTNLTAACYYGSIESIRVLLGAGVDVNLATNETYEDFPKYTALHAAADQGYNDIIKLLLEKNPDLEKENGKGETALATACRKKKIETVKLLYENGAKIPESSAEEIIKGLDFLETEEEKSKSLQVRIKLIDDKRDERLSKDRIESIINGEELGPNNTFTNDTKFKAITSIPHKIKSGDIKANSVSGINPLYRKLIELKEIGVENKDVANINDKIIKAALENPKEFEKLFKTTLQINKVRFEDDDNLIVKADSDEEKSKILHDLKLVLNPSSYFKLNKQSFYDGVEKLGNTLSAEFMKALGGEDNAKKLINNLLGDPSPSISPRGERGITVQASHNENSI